MRLSRVTEIVTKFSGDPTQASRTRVILTEAAAGGWGLSGTAFGQEEFAVTGRRRPGPIMPAGSTGAALW
jgi:hypothetical protein